MATTEQKSIAVIGAGLTGICALRRLSENRNFKLTCFEKNYEVGGLWLYTDQTDVDNFGRTIHSALYNNMKTNLPKQCMEIEGFPMDAYPAFPDHRQIRHYLNHIADTCDIRKYIKFNTEVKCVKPVDPTKRDTQWTVTYDDIRNKNGRHTVHFDAVIICSGNCAHPKYPVLQGEEDFEGFITHSMRYRHPEVFSGQTVAVLGAHYSGMDICFDLYKYAEKIYLCHNKDALGANLPDNVLEKTSGFRKFTRRSVVLDNGEELLVDSVIYCTGYKYSFPYLPDGIVEVGKDNLINNLYKYIIPAEYTNLFFMGILRQVLLFPLADYQALFIRAALEGSAKLPEKVEMLKIITEDSKRTIDERNQQEWNKELSEIAGNFKPLPPVLYNIRNHHFGIYWKDLPKSKSVCYQVKNVESFVVN